MLQTGFFLCLLFGGIAHPHVVEDERVDVGLFFQYLGQGLATTVTSLGVDADEDGVGTLVTLLQGGSELK